MALAAACCTFAAFYIILASAALQGFLSDGDTFLHISVGNWMLRHGRFLFTDPFSYTAHGKAWDATDWVSEIALALLFRIGGWFALTQIVALTAALIGALLAFYLATKLRLSVALGLTVVILVLISPHFLARPVLFSYVLLAGWIALILEIEDRDEWTGRLPLALIPLMVLWANVHAGFTFGLLVFYFFVGHAIYQGYSRRKRDSLKRLGILLAGVSIAAIITPYGPLSALKTVRVMNIPALASILEWHAPDFQNDKVHLFSIVGLFGGLLFLGVRVRGPRLLTLLMVTVFALEHERGILLFALVGPLMVVRPCLESAFWPRIPVDGTDPVAAFAARRSGSIALACAAATIVAGLAFAIAGRTAHPPGRAMPIKALSAAENAGLVGHVLNSYGFGGYLIFKGIPPFVDGRVGLYGNQFLQRYMASMSLANPTEADALLKQYHVKWALLQPKSPIAFMLRSQGWAQIYRGRHAIVLAKNR